MTRSVTSIADPISAHARSEQPSELKELDQSLARLKEAAPSFARLGARSRADLLRRCARGVADCAEAWVAEGHRRKRLEEDAAEEWFVGPIPTLRNIRLLIQTLERLHLGRATLHPTAVSTRPDGRVEAKVFPTDAFDAVLFAGVEAKQRMLEGQTERSVLENGGSIYHGQIPEPGTSLILGAGNVSSIPPMDALYKSFAEGYVCIIKMNPVNEWSGRFLERAFAPLIEAGIWSVVYGDAEVGEYLTQHALVDDIHITGSNHTHDLIVWGPPGPERQRRMAEGDPILRKTISSELGNVSPVAIVPHEYSDRELDSMAWNLAAMVTNNASFNCNAAKMLVVSKAWSQKDRLLGLVKRALATVPTRYAYYPGAQDRFHQLTGGRPQVEMIGERKDGYLPWTLIHDVDPNQADDPVLRTEPFCSILSITQLDAADPAAFLAESTRFLNEKLWGTLNAMLVLPRVLEKSLEVGASLDRAIRDLKYGTIGINHWPALSYALTSPAWGGHPSSSLRDIQSGLGWVHNTYLLQDIEKTILRGPINLFPKPIWFPSHRAQAKMGPKLVAMEADPSWWKVPQLGITALRA